LREERIEVKVTKEIYDFLEGAIAGTMFVILLVFILVGGVIAFAVYTLIKILSALI